ncbi:hypothetical protein B0H15DRAFT_955850 [Mycena belliarum]|uniref:Uncharacterized protein n=1 Tax=Mycena belliarum TaxID=1033014 RepID=A0AAD6TRN0_9AGAR|nr:hypothetical protein B0H15DRAFT_955850 [Mycena belliae]
MSGTAVLAYSDIGSHSFELEDTQGSASASPIGQRGTRYVRPVEPLGGAAPLRFCDRVCSRSAGAVATERRIVRARLGPRLPPPPSLRPPRPSSLVPRPSSLVPRLERRFELGVGGEGSEHERAASRPRPPYVASPRIRPA